MFFLFTLYILSLVHFLYKKQQNFKKTKPSYFLKVQNVLILFLLFLTHSCLLTEKITPYDGSSDFITKDGFGEVQIILLYVYF